MKIKKIRSCFACWSPPLGKGPKDEENVNLDNRFLSDSNEIDDAVHLSYVEGVDFCIEENGQRHRTDKYEHMQRKENPELVVRRGDEFKLRIALKEMYDKDRDVMTFLFKCRDRRVPNYSHGTLIGVTMTEKPQNPYSWSVVLEEVTKNSIVVSVRPAPTCIVGVWDLEIDTQTIERHTYRSPNPIYIIYNPWCVNDEVYMESGEWKDEAVLSSDGLVWRGSPNYPTLWKYAQFERDVLDCALYLITNVGGLSGYLRSDLVAVTRALSAAVNVNDDYGVVVGNWSNDYTGGKAPSYWTGSKDILQEFYKTKKPVRYGQCWVFAGVLTSVCRALGLPSRVITNFSSAHDSNGSITIDYIVDKTGKIVDEFDSIWNFHVWSEIWMKRADLGEAYDGWQVIDATPQEASNGMYRCGPASVAACKQGDVSRPYDVPFLFSEVNADRVYWLYDEETDVWKLLRKETNSIGKNISTKTAGAFSRLDLTETYKYPENSKAERAVYLKAMRQLDHEFSRLYLNENFEDVVFTFEYLDDIIIGQNFTVTLKMENRNSEKDHEISAVLRVDVIRYTGKYLASIKSHSRTVSVDRNDSTKLQISITYDDYKKVLEDNCIFIISCLAQVKGTNYQYYDRDDFRMVKPGVDIDMRTATIRGQEVTAKVKITNPLPVPIKKGKFIIDAPGFDKQITIDVKDKIQPGQVAVEEFKFVPEQLGRQTVAAKFMSTELHDLNGFYYFVVSE
ncbi:Tg [Trypoxylus dichotomus]